MYRLPRARVLRLRPQIPARTQFTRTAQRRYASRTVENADSEPVRHRGVRFVKQGLTLRRIATFGLYTGAAYAYLQLVGRYWGVQVEILDEDADAEMEEVEDEDEDSEYTQEDSLFIPLTWSKQMPKTFYRGSDPEWQEFVKVAKDKERHRKIQDELVQIVFSGSLKHPGLTRQLGKEPKIGKFWLDISFPDGPPQEFERSGIEIGDGYISWSRQKVSPENQWRLMRALWPQAAFDSLWATGKVLVGIQYRRLKESMGWENTDLSSPESRYRHALDMMQKQQHEREQKELGNTQTDPNGNPGSVVRSSGTSEDQSPQPSSTDGKKIPWQIQIPLPSIPGAANSADLPIAMHVFSSTLNKSWNPKKVEPPRGTFVVQGLIEVRASRGRILFDVQSCYDPKVGKFVVVTAGVRNFKRWNQAPRGGP